MTSTASIQENKKAKATQSAGARSAVLDAGWVDIDGVQNMRPFLTTLASEDNHWAFIASNGGVTLGRHSPEGALFPYLTEDKLRGLAHINGPVTRVRYTRRAFDGRLWAPWESGSTPSGERSLHKRADGTQLKFVERDPLTNLQYSYTWGAAQRYGFIRKVELCNRGAHTLSVEVLDGLRNVNPAGLSEAFQSQFGILGLAYTRGEMLEPTGLRLLYLNSAPTDRAEPSESLQANVIWAAGAPPHCRLLTCGQLADFEAGAQLEDERESRGVAAGALNQYCFTLEPGARVTWYWVLEVGLSAARIAGLNAMLAGHSDAALVTLLESGLAENSAGLRAIVAAVDGLQHGADRARLARHQSNALFNCMRGGVFIDGYSIPAPAVRDHFANFNPQLAQRHGAWLAQLPENVALQQLLGAAQASEDPSFTRICMELLPLTFSRRHGDPSRPWNKFAITVRGADGKRKLAYQGNWRDIFQNWEALLYSFPGYAESVIAKFLNATTADGYNPYRITEKGFDWEKLEPDEPWSNIGYWGDHQIIYLLRLLELSRAFQPEALAALLRRPVYAFANVPYRIKPLAAVLDDPRDSIEYAHEVDAAIAARVGQMGADAALLQGADGAVHHSTLLEKLLIPLLAKLANFVPQGGIWMNTQRPEWNDANNALAGYGLSVVTLAYCRRYAAFLRDWLAALPENGGWQLSAEVSDWLAAQQQILAGPAAAMDGAQRLDFIKAMGASADAYRAKIYAKGFVDGTRQCAASMVCDYLDAALTWLEDGIHANRREDGLYHSYNLLELEHDAAHIGRLEEMLEGQVAVLSSGALDAAQSLALLDALRASALYRPDQGSYLLYPDRALPGFLDKNKLEPALVESNPLALALLALPQPQVIEKDVTGCYRFAAGFRNRAEMEAKLEALPHTLQPLVAAHGPALCAAFERQFRHQAFTGRSSTFFAYEGLGSIYWHMVSKLILAQQEVLFESHGINVSLQNALIAHYRETLEGLGFHKTPTQYGAFPSDAYSHTPKHAGAQQPGMTGQVKEDLIIRRRELGLFIDGGAIHFDCRLFDRGELRVEADTFEYIDVHGRAQGLAMPPHAFAYTFCQVPVVYRTGQTAALRLDIDGVQVTMPEPTRIPAQWAQHLFARDGKIRSIELTLSAQP